MKKKVILYSSIVIMLILAIVGTLVIRHYIYPLKYTSEILEYSKKYNIDPYLILAMVNVESGFDKEATSAKGAKGLMQITKATAQEINQLTNSVDKIDDNSLYDININLDIGCMYLASLIERYDGNYYLAICAYNAGMGNVNKWISEYKVPTSLATTHLKLPFNETTNYLKKVVRNYSSYKKIYHDIS